MDDGDPEEEDGADADPDDEDGAELDDGVDPDAGAVEGLAVLVSRVSRGGPSSDPIPTGDDSAFATFTVGSVPVGRHTPVPSHGIAAFGLLLCRALPMVKSPREFPERSPS